MMGYNNLTAYDWSHYFEGGVCFHLAPSGVVRAYYMCHLTDYEQEPEYEYDEYGERYEIPPEERSREGEFVDRDCHCLLRECGNTDGGIHTERRISLRTLFESRQWIVHRFQLGYVPIGPSDLAFVGMEPRSSRMVKSLHPSNMYTHGIISGQNATGAHVDVSTLARIRTGLTSGRSLRHSDRWPDVWNGICKVLSYGKAPIFRSTSVSTVDMVREMLATPVKDRVLGVLCPDFTTAIIAHRSTPRVGYVVTNGSVVGTLTSALGRVVLHAPVTQWEDKSARKLAKEALKTKALNLYADEVIFEV